MKLEDLLKKVNNPDDIPLLKEAYEYANSFMEGKLRRNGETLMSHALEVANILVGLNVDTTTLVCAILHEILTYDEDGNKIKEKFGEEVYSILESINKINGLEMLDDSEDSAIYLRKVMVGLSENVRVLFIKLADRLHNMRTMDCLNKNHQKKVANETLSVLVPIAHRLGINSIKSELENLCLYYLKPEVYNDILEKLNDTTAELNEYLNEMKLSICKILNENGIKFEIKGRVKSVYSIYNKLNNGKKWNDIYDILALRVFVEKESECYQVVGLIHSKYKPVPKRFKDYIAIPKENMYQSLHTTVTGPGNHAYEVQIRTYEMDEIAEKGIASHWSYKEKGTKKIQTMMEQKLELYRSIIENNQDKETDEFTKVVDNDILSDMIYVFTPKGDVVELPKGSTPLDFAYRIHSKVGETMVGAIVNDVMVPISSELHENDSVKIMTSPTGKPNKDWLNLVKTTQAKNKIKAYFSKIDKDEYIFKGKSILEKEIRKRKLSINDILSNENVEKLCEGLKLKDIEDIYVSIGSFRYTANFIINYVEGNDTEDTLVVKRRVPGNISHKSDILVDGSSDIQTHLAKCCNPVCGDEIVGVINKIGGIAVHRHNCTNITGTQDHQVPVCWNNNIDNFYTATIMITSNTSCNITDITASLNANNILILALENTAEGIYKVNVRVKNIDEIDKTINLLMRMRYIRDVKRI